MSPTRRTALLAVPALLVAAVGVAVVGAGGSPSPDVLGAAPEPSRSAPTSTTTPMPPAKAPTAEPTALQTASARSTAVTTAPSPRRTTRTPDLGAAPGVVSHPYDPGRRTYRATAQGVSITATLSAVRARTGEPVTITVEGTRAEPTCCSLHVLYGDGGSDSAQETACPRPATTARSATFRHTWNRSGRWVLQLRAAQSGCGGGSAEVLMRVTVDITPGTTVGNGPYRPRVKVNQSEPPRPGDSSYASYYGTAHEEDGYLTKLVLDYGDGTPPKTFRGDLHPCREGPGGQPGASDADLPFDPPHSHHYAEPGEYVVTLTAYSAGCDGKDVQSGSASFTYAAY